MSQPEVHMYCTPFCPDCAHARVWLEHHAVHYTDIDISTSLDLREKVAALNDGALHTPTFDIAGEIIVGFEKERLLEVLNITD